MQAQINQIDRTIAATYAEGTRTRDQATRNPIKPINPRISQFQRDVATNFDRLNRHRLRMLQAAAAGDAPAPLIQAPIVCDPEQRQPNVDQNADLCPTPRTLHELWMEWKSGISAENLPARLFTVRERGRRKRTFCQRKAFWEVVQLMA